MFQDLIEKRRSIREFTDQPVSRELVEDICQAVFYAPTGRNEDDIRLIAVEDPEMIRELSAFKPTGAAPLKEAKVALCVLSDRELAPKTHRQDACIATTYALLKVTDLGLGACWINVNSAEGGQERVHEILGLDDRWNVESIIAIGHPGEDKGPKEPRDFRERTRWI